MGRGHATDRGGIGDWHVSDISLEALVTYAGEPDLIFHCACGSSVVAFPWHIPIKIRRSSRTCTISLTRWVENPVLSAVLRQGVLSPIRCVSIAGYVRIFSHS
jgi:hypothetical protein